MVDRIVSASVKGECLTTLIYDIHRERGEFSKGGDKGVGGSEVAVADCGHSFHGVLYWCFWRERRD